MAGKRHLPVPQPDALASIAADQSRPDGSDVAGEVSLLLAAFEQFGQFDRTVILGILRRISQIADVDSEAAAAGALEEVFAILALPFAADPSRNN